MFQSTLKTKMGEILIREIDGKIVEVSFQHKITTPDNTSQTIEYCKKELTAYFKGNKTNFDSPVHLEGTEFQKKVWTYLKTIPYGKIVSYHDVAVAIGNKNGVRAVGSANGKNNIAILIPCHRVVGKSGKLVGYRSGIEKKKYLLELEGIRKKNELFLF